MPAIMVAIQKKSIDKNDSDTLFLKKTIYKVILCRFKRGAAFSNITNFSIILATVSLYVPLKICEGVTTAKKI
jgi:hypothetical protein